MLKKVSPASKAEERENVYIPYEKERGDESVYLRMYVLYKNP